MRPTLIPARVTLIPARVTLIPARVTLIPERSRRALFVLALLFLGACKTIPKTPQSALDALAVAPAGHLTGTPVALGPPLILNREDFVYDVRPSADAKLVALSRLGMKSFHLAIHALGPPAEKRADVAINPLEFDVEALDFSPDGKVIATVSRDGALRLFSAADGKPVGAWLTEEPLASVAWHPSGEALALGSAKGLVTIVSFPAMGHVAELRPHQDEVRGLAFAPSGTLFSGGWDKRLAVLELQDATTPPRTVRTHFTKKGGQVLFRAVFDQAASGTVTVDARTPLVALRGALAQAAGIDVAMLTETVTLPTAMGNQIVKLAKGRRVAFKGLVFDGIDVAICDACVPTDAQGVIGAQLLDRLELAFDESTSEAQLTAKEGAPGVASSAAKTLAVTKQFTFGGAVNDLSIDAKGAVLGVAFSETKAERTREVYEREKRKEVEPEREWDCGARIDAASGAVLEKKKGHRGVVASAAISPDGKTLATAGWDKKLVLHGAETFVDDDFGWALRRARFSRDGRWLVVAAWTPQNPLNDHQSDPSAVVYEVLYRDATVER